MIPLVFLAGFVGAWEFGWWAHRRSRRSALYQQALQAARSLRRPLVVIGAPDGGVTSGYGCGDITIDWGGSCCPRVLQIDITKGIPLPNDSAVCYTSCVLEYVSNPAAALAEIQRISGGWAYFVGVPPWTLTAYLYPGAKWTLPEGYR